MAKVCPQCEDGIEYSDADIQCSICGEALVSISPRPAEKAKSGPGTVNEPPPPTGPTKPNRPQGPNIDGGHGDRPPPLNEARMIRGTVLHTAKTPLRGNLIVRLHRTLSYGIPLEREQELTAVHLLVSNGVQEASNVVYMYGCMINGDLIEGNQITVYGRRNKRNILIARRIENNSSNQIVKPLTDSGIPAGLVRALSVLLLGILLSTIVRAGRNWWLQQVLPRAMPVVMTILILLAVYIWLRWSWSRRIPRRRRW